MRKEKNKKKITGLDDERGQWRNHTRAITGSARDEFISAWVEPVLKMRVSLMLICIWPNEIFLLRTAV